MRLCIKDGPYYSVTCHPDAEDDDDEDDVVVALVSKKGRAAALTPAPQADQNITAPAGASKQAGVASVSPANASKTVAGSPEHEDEQVQEGILASSPARQPDSKRASSQKVGSAQPYQGCC